MSRPNLIITGSIAIDRIMNFSGRYRDVIKPDKLHVLSLSLLLDKLETSNGGSGANIAYNSALLGDHPILYDSVGRDGEDYIKQLQAAGVNTDYVHVSDTPTASFSVITDMEGSQVGGFYPGAMSDSSSLTLAPWKGQDVIVVMSPHDPEAMSRQIKEANELGMKLVFDPGQQTVDPTTDVELGVKTAEIVLVNDYEQTILCERLRIASEELRAKVPILITTLGAQGSVIEGSKVSKPLSIGVAKPDQAVDPTGAGDAYRAGFLYGYLRQWDLVKSAQLGATLASFVVEKHGTQHKVSKDQIATRYRVNFNEEITL